MAKDKSSATASKPDKATKATAKAAAKAERKAARKVRKDEKLAKKGGVTKPGKKEVGKKDKEKRKALAERALNEIEGKNAKEDGEEEESGSEEEEEGEEMDVSGVRVGASSEEEEEKDEEDTKQSGVTAPSSEDKSTKKQHSLDEKQKLLAARPIGALVPFANPLADEKVAKKVFKSVKKAAAHRTLKRGVKEVVKALRKSPATTTTSTLPIGIVILAADISPMDVISHIPVLAEDHNIPYIYVTSRAELGIAGMTKRPTSVVMVARDAVAKKGKDAKEDDGEGWEETYKSLVKVVEREGGRVKV